MLQPVPEIQEILALEAQIRVNQDDYPREPRKELQPKEGWIYINNSQQPHP